MRCLRWLLIVVILASTHVNAQDDDTNAGMCPISPKLGDEPSRHYWLHGMIGTKAARMYIERGGNTVAAVFYYTESTWTPIVLGGRWNTGKPTASDKTGDKPATGQLTGAVTTTGFAGYWMHSNGNPPLPVKLDFEPKPACKISGASKRFDDPNWPITFSYPAAMQLSHTEWGLSLSCPDPADMFYDKAVEISQGPMITIGDEGFHLSGSKWMRDSDYCDAKANHAPGCAEAVVSHKGSLTILDDGEQEWRIYCTGGGYVGLVYGEQKVLVAGGKWVKFSGSGDYGNLALGILTSAKIR
jgi:hypothetical protein